jgi:hypothetical protein
MFRERFDESCRKGGARLWGSVVECSWRTCPVRRRSAKMWLRHVAKLLSQREGAGEGEHFPLVLMTTGVFGRTER